MIITEQAWARAAPDGLCACLTDLGFSDAHQAVAALDCVADALLRAHDARAAFPDIYAVITRQVADEAARPDGPFLEPTWISRLAGRFCARYLETLRWSLAGCPQDADAWASAYLAEGDAELPPVQHALLGMSAHINYDLAIVIHATIVERGDGQDRAKIARYKHDHDCVNTLLDASIPEAIDRLIRRHRCATTRWLERAGRLTRWFTMELLTRWRDHVWIEVEALLAARTRAQRARVIRRIGARAARLGVLLRRPLPARPRASKQAE
jgi:Family of unknown function (DUF5995)